MKNKKCSNCRYFDDFTVEENGTGSGLCLRYPPVAVAAFDPDHECPEDKHFAWPSVGVAAWCGEWKRRKE